YMLLLPLIVLILGRRTRWFLLIGTVLVGVGRALMFGQTDLSPMLAAGLAVCGGLVYLTALIRHRASMLPYMLILGIGADQIFRAYGNTLDPSWSRPYINIQVALSTAAIIISLINVVLQ